MDNLERATLGVLNHKHQFICTLGAHGHGADEIKKIVDLIDWEKQTEFVVMCYDNCDKQAEAEGEAAANLAAQQQAAQSGS